MTNIHISLDSDSRHSQPEADNTEPVIKQDRYSKPRTWPILLYVICMLLLDACFFPLLDVKLFWGWVYPCIFTAGLGQIAFACVLTGWYGRAWPSGVWLGTLLVTAGYCTVLLTTNFIRLQFHQVDIASMLPWAALIPSGLLLGAAPLLIIRWWRGWRLERSPSKRQLVESKQVEDNSLEDIFWALALCASAVYLAGFPKSVLGLATTHYWSNLATIALFSIVAAFGLILPTATLMFARRSFKLQLVLSLATTWLAVAIVCVFFFTAQWQSQARAPFLTWLIYGVAGGIGLSVGFWLGLAALRISGLQIVRPTKNITLMNSHERSIDPLAKETGDIVGVASKDSRRWQIRVYVAMFLFVGIGTGLASTFVREQQRDALENNFRLNLIQRKNGGAIGVQDFEVTQAALGKAGTDSDLYALANYKSIKDLSLANSKITSKGLTWLCDDRFPQLESLNLSACEIDSRTVRKLSELPIRHLGLSRTSINVDDVRYLLRSLPLDSIDLSACSLSQAELISLGPELANKKLALRDYGYTDQQLTPILTSLYKDSLYSYQLDLSGNPIDGTCLVDCGVTRWDHLILKKCRLKDSVFLKLSPARFINALEIENSGLTDAALPGLVGIRRLHIGNGQITEIGLANSQVRPQSLLGLHGKQFTGDYLKLTSFFGQLDLSHSAVTNVNALRLAMNAYRINLSHTQINDNALLKLSHTNLSEIDLSHTEVTYRGLKQCEFGNVSAVFIDFDRCSIDECKNLMQAIPLHVGGSLKGRL